MTAMTLLVARQLGRIGLGIVDTGDYGDLFRAHANGNGARSEL
jgi:hypothetical protein